MNYKIIGKTISQILMIESVLMLPSLIFGFVDKQNNVIISFAISIVVTFFVGLILMILCGKANKDFYAKEGFVSVGLGWIFMSLFGSLPLFLSKEFPSFIDSLFEIVSGFTTTGATILLDVESISRGILYWRSFSHWLGGMGVLVFILAIIPRNNKNSGGFSIHMMRAESPGPTVGKLVPKIGKTALVLYAIYIALTVTDFIALIIAKMPWFDALCTAFGTAGTGGFGIKNSSIGDYSAAIQIICTVFMLLFGINFNVYYLIILKHFKSALKNEEVRLYLIAFTISTIIISINTFQLFDTVGETIRHSAFQVSSIMTTTGFSTVDFNSWPSLSKAILVILMLFGACSGSTGGGMKISRLILLWKSLVRSVKKMLHPRRVQIVKNDGNQVDESVIINTNIYLIAYFLIIIVSFLIISIDNFSTETNLTAVIACFNNIGPGLDMVGPIGNYASFSIVSKIVLIIDMLAGRLEIFPIALLFFSRTWKKSV